ncbi:MAG: ABC transporter ATP-binding protein [Elusimicrobia bacterium]|nr:ABC transporter ATP-binding protein [Candidatus Obscuribacterium magneticum]
MTPILELKNISKSFGDLVVLRQVDLTLEKGTSIAIVGPSGAGKSTLLHIAGLMEKPSGGEVWINGHAGHTLPESERARERLNTIGFLFQFHYLLPDFNVLENVLLPPRLAGDELESATQEAKRILDRLGLTPRLHHLPSQLSGGEQQRTALARALIRHPKLLLCDEPTGNLDKQHAAEMMDLLWAEMSQYETAVILVTHNEALAKRTRMSYHLSDGQFQ